MEDLEGKEMQEAMGMEKEGMGMEKEEMDKMR
jgi:hypothetical protein